MAIALSFLGEGGAIAPWQHAAQAYGFSAPGVYQIIGFGAFAGQAHPVFAEGEFVLCPHQIAGDALLPSANLAAFEGAIAPDFLILFGGNGSADFLQQFFADDAPLPHATAPEDDEDHDEKWEKQNQIEDAFLNPDFQEAELGRRGGFCAGGDALGTGGEGKEQAQTIIEGVGKDGEQPTDQGRDDLHPAFCGLQCQSQERAEESAVEGMPCHAKQGEACAKLQAPGRDAKFRIAGGDVVGRFQPVEANADECAVDEAIAHVVELGIEEDEQRQNADAFDGFFHQRTRDRCADEECRFGTEGLLNQGILGNPATNLGEDGAVDGSRQARGDDAAPEEGCGDRPGRFPFPPIEVPQDGDGHDGEHRRNA